MAEARHSAGMKPYVVVWIGLILIVAIEVLLTYQRLPAGRLLAFLLVLAFIAAALGVMDFVHLRYERAGLVWSLHPFLVSPRSMMLQLCPPPFRLVHPLL